MLTLDEAIKHAEEKTEELTIKSNKLYEKHYEESSRCQECAEEHAQLAEWLKQLQEVKKVVDDWHTIRNIQDANDAMADYFNQIIEALKGGKG